MSKRDNDQLALFLQYGFTQPILPKRVGRPPFVKISNNTNANYNGVVDAPIREAAPTINYGTADFQGSSKFEAGFFGTGDRTNTVIKFGGLTGAGTGTVTNAKLRLFVVFGSNNTVNASVLNTAFDVNTVTWNIRQTATNWNVAGVYSGTDVSAVVAASALCPVSSANTYLELTGTGLDTYVQNVLNGATDNGLLLYDNNQTVPGSSSSFVSSEGVDLTRPELVFTLTPSTGTNFTGTLTGQSVTSATGTVVYTLSKTLVGQSLSALTSTLIYSFDKTLSGQSILGSTGTVVFDPNMSFTGTLTGQSSNATTGLLTYAFYKTLVGQGVVTATGSVVYSFNTTLVGQPVTAATGNITYTFSKSLIGQPTTSNTGVLVYSFDKTLSGQQVSGSTGTIVYSSSIDFTGSLVGQSVGASTGLLTYTFDKSLVGQSASSTQGIFTYSFNKTLGGQPVTSFLGTIVYQSQIDLVATLVGIGKTASTGSIIYGLITAKKDKYIEIFRRRRR